MKPGISTVIYPVTDLAKAKQTLSTLLGVEPIADQPYYVGFQVEGQNIGLVPYGQNKGMTGPVCYFEVSDIKATVAQLVSTGLTVQQDVNDVGGGLLVAALRDQDNNPIGLRQQLAAG